MERDENDPRPFPGPNAGRPNSPYKFNAEELKVLKACNRESFYQRCLPLSVLLGGGMYYAVKTGTLQGSAKYGPVPKVCIGVIVGYFMGKFSYQGKCAEKLMLLPSSPIGEMLRQRKKGGLQESLDPGFGPGMSLAPFSGMTTSDTYSDVSPRSTLDMDTSRPDAFGLDDSHRPSMDNPIHDEELPPMQKNITSYDAMRKQNREEYQQNRVGSYRAPLSAQQSPNNPQLPSPDYKPEPDVPKLQTNKYGDSWG